MLGMCKECSPGHDEITYGMLKNAHHSMVQLILKLYNQVYKSKTFPKQWQISVIIPIHKPGKDPSLATNYRPIALTGCLCKLIEKIINVRLSNYLEKENKINKVQSGFRRNRSTTDNLVKIETSVREAIDNDNDDDNFYS